MDVWTLLDDSLVLRGHAPSCVSLLRDAIVAWLMIRGDDGDGAAAHLLSTISSPTFSLARWSPPACVGDVVLVAPWRFENIATIGVSALVTSYLTSKHVRESGSSCMPSHPHSG